MKMRRFISVLMCLCLLLSMVPSAYAATVPGATPAPGRGCNHMTDTGAYAVEYEGEEPTCTENGMDRRYCALCGQTLGTEPGMPALGHDWNQWFLHQDATCTEDGYYWRDCDRCGIEETKPIPALGHDWSDWYTVQEATYTQQGILERKCQRCGITERQYLDMLEREDCVGLSLDMTEISPYKALHSDGDVIEYEYTVTNTGTLMLFDIQLVDVIQTASVINPDYTWLINALAPGEYYYGTFSLTVDAESMCDENNVLDIEFSAEGVVYDNDFQPVEYADSDIVCFSYDIDGDTGADAALSLSVTQTSPEKSIYADGEVVTYDYTVTNTGTVTLYGIQLNDIITKNTGNESADTWLTDALAPGESYNGSFSFAMDAQTMCDEYGLFNIIFQANGKVSEDVSDYTYSDIEIFVYHIGEDGENTALAFTIHQTSPIKSVYSDCEEITYAYTITNTGTVGFDRIYLRETIPTCRDNPGWTYASRVCDRLEPGESYDGTCSIIANSGILCDDNGVLLIDYSAEGVCYDSDNNPYNNTQSDIVSFEYQIGEAEELESSLYLDAWVEKIDGDNVIVGWEITNDGNTDLIDHSIWTDSDGVSGISSLLEPGWAIDTISNPGYVLSNNPISAAERAAGVKTITVSASSVSGNDIVYSNVVELTVYVDPHTDAAITLEMYQTSTVKPYYTDGDIITYDYIITNVGSVTITDLELRGVWSEDSVTMMFTSLNVGSVLPVGGQITGSDMQQLYDAYGDGVGLQEAVFTAWGNYYDNGTKTVISNSCEFEYIFGEEAHGAELTVTKSVANEPAEGFKAGDTIEYVIVVENTSDVRAENITVTDPLKGEYDGDPVLGYISALEPNCSETYTFYYVLPQEVFEYGQVVNYAVANWYDDIEQRDRTACSARVILYFTDDNPVEQNVILTKEITNMPAKGYYSEGETISYKVTIHNNTNQDLTHLTISDPMVGVYLMLDGTMTSYEEPIELYCDYTVTAGDIGYDIVNTAYATLIMSESGESMYVISNDVIAHTQGEPSNESLVVFLYEDGSPKEDGVYKLGETVNYFAVVYNNGSEPVYNIECTALRTMDDYDPHILATNIPCLMPNESYGICFSTVVNAYDAGTAHKIDNIAFADGWGKNNTYVWADSNMVTVPCGGDVTETPEEVYDYCKNELKAAGMGVLEYEQYYCVNHHDAVADLYSKLAENESVETLREIIDVWNTEISKLYARIRLYGTADAGIAALREMKAFDRQMADTEAVLTAQLGETEALKLVCGLLAEKCSELCYEVHTAPANRSDSIAKDVAASTQSMPTECASGRYFAFDSTVSYTETYCPKHAGMLTATISAAKAPVASNVRTMVMKTQQNAWMSILDSELKGKEYAAARSSYAEYIKARTNLLNELYPYSPDMVSVTVVKAIIERTQIFCR